MTSAAIERLKYRGRVAAGACLHAAGLYRRLLPVYLRNPTGPSRRLQAYLTHYYEQVDHAEAELYLEGLGLRVACDIKDHMLWHYLEGAAPIYEQLEIDHCRTLVQPGDHIVDIGANHGFWGFGLAQQAGREARLYLAEPNPVVLNRLRRTATLNPSIRARIIDCAVTDGNTPQVTFYLPAGNLSGLGSTVLHASAQENGYLEAGRRTTVRARSLDALVAAGEVGGIDMLKIDVEQGEDAVIRGGLVALERFRPRLAMMETSPGSAASVCLTALGYRTYRLDNDGSIRDVEPDFWGNIFFERRD